MHEPERAVGILAAAWMLVFGLPLFLFTPDSAGNQAQRRHDDSQGTEEPRSRP